ncbi:MAG: hypothetical protein BWY73_01297 [candidate division TA06 bacterium ADurb.Bin417]|uniref:Uncharacterized protein n=1 Tax=candidate division TA06 bacterium ADurb.Bin417 TaxID=1852828 RepID=A0A1V5MBD9_UNCT6|nr:MAG: hypothetical protein BWY73_01297 [candidate division TA06 bacterium ADurb.Bin417]
MDRQPAVPEPVPPAEDARLRVRQFEPETPGRQPHRVQEDPGQQRIPIIDEPVGLLAVPVAGADARVVAEDARLAGEVAGQPPAEPVGNQGRDDLSLPAAGVDEGGQQDLGARPRPDPDLGGPVGNQSGDAGQEGVVAVPALDRVMLVEDGPFVIQTQAFGQLEVLQRVPLEVEEGGLVRGEQPAARAHVLFDGPAEFRAQAGGVGRQQGAVLAEAAGGQVLLQHHVVIEARLVQEFAPALEFVGVMLVVVAPVAAPAGVGEEDGQVGQRPGGPEEIIVLLLPEGPLRIAPDRLRTVAADVGGEPDRVLLLAQVGRAEELFAPLGLRVEDGEGGVGAAPGPGPVDAQFR